MTQGKGHATHRDKRYLEKSNFMVDGLLTETALGWKMGDISDGCH
jgi:hypothetical protein